MASCRRTPWRFGPPPACFLIEIQSLHDAVQRPPKVDSRSYLQWLTLTEYGSRYPELISPATLQCAVRNRTTRVVTLVFVFYFGTAPGQRFCVLTSLDTESVPAQPLSAHRFAAHYPEIAEMMRAPGVAIKCTHKGRGEFVIQRVFSRAGDEVKQWLVRDLAFATQLCLRCFQTCHCSPRTPWCAELSVGC